MKNSQEYKSDEELDLWFLENLVCPIDKSRLSHQKKQLICSEHKHSYPIFKNIPIMLVKEIMPTHSGFFQRTWDIVNEKVDIETNLKNEAVNKNIDPYVQEVIAATNSNFYVNLIKKLKRYPIPNFPKVPAAGRLLLDIGCNWGRWCLSASKSGFDPIGIDPILESILAAKRVAKQLNIKSKYLVADARYLPFRQNLFDYCYSYSVLQHFSKSDVKKVLPQIKYVLKPRGISQLQMLNKYGLRSLYIQMRRNFREPVEFETRYWSYNELLNVFEQNIGASKILLGSFFTQAQITELDLFTLRNKLIFGISQFFNNLSLKIPYLKKYGDNLFLISQK